MFNLSGSEIVFLLIIGLVVLGPEKLPPALRKAGRLYGEFRRITSGAESDFRSTFAEPIREMQSTVSTYKNLFTDAASGVTAVAKDVKTSFINAATTSGEPEIVTSPAHDVSAEAVQEEIQNVNLENDIVDGI